MGNLIMEQLQAIDALFTAEIVEVFEYESTVQAKSSKGRT